MSSPGIAREDGRKRPYVPAISIRKAPCTSNRDGRNKSEHGNQKCQLFVREFLPTRCRQEELATKRPATKRPTMWPACKRSLGPDLLQTPGGWGLRNPVFEGRPDPEATGACVTFQLGVRLFEFGRHYDVIKESVRPRDPLRAGVDAATALISILPLARAPVRRNHLSNRGHT